MKTRIITSVIGLGILGVVLFFYDTILINAILFLLSAVAILELFNAAGLTKYKFLTAVSLLFCLVLSFRGVWPVDIHFGRISFGFIVTLFLYQVIKHGSMRVEHVCYAFFMTTLIPLSFYSLVEIKAAAGAQLGVFYLFLALGSAWWADTGAFFVGTFFGKHKLCPKVSPNKTVEGFIGGIATAILGNLLICVSFELLSNNGLFPLGYFTETVKVNIPLTLLFTPFLSLLGVLGDLSASVIKRQHEIKDFGHIMPGHGGVMDRFDSVLLIPPAIFIIFNIFPLISVI